MSMFVLNQNGLNLKGFIVILAAMISSPILLAPATTHGADEGVWPERGRIVIFASERLGRDWIESHFNTIPEGAPSYNQCEISLGTTLQAMGFKNSKQGFTRSERARAKKLRTVFRRYKDMSTMANDTAVKASHIVDSEADAVVLCTVEAGPKRRWRRQSDVQSCAEVRCKAISTSDSKRVAVHSINRCAKGPEEAGASVEAIRSVCSEAGQGLGKKIIERKKI